MHGTTGDVVFFEADPEDYTAQLVKHIDRSTFEMVDYSHAGIVCPTINGSSALVHMTKRGLFHEPLASALPGRSMLTIDHPDGDGAAGAAAQFAAKGAPYDMIHLALATVAALLRDRGVGKQHRERAWELIHFLSRQICGVRTSDCERAHQRVDHLIPAPDVPHFVCTSFVDQAFRHAGRCLCVLEPTVGSRRRPGLIAAVRERMAGEAGWILGGGLKVIGHRLFVVGEPTDPPDRGDDLRVPVLDPATADDDGDGADPDPQFTLGDVGERLAIELYPVEASMPAGTYYQQLVDILATKLQRLFDYIDKWFRRFRTLQLDGLAAPQPEEPTWPPFMSLQLLMDRLNERSTHHFLPRPKPTPALI